MYPTLTKQLVDDHMRELRRTARARRLRPLRRTRRRHADAMIRGALRGAPPGHRVRAGHQRCRPGGDHIDPGRVIGPARDQVFPRAIARRSIASL